MYFRLTTLVLFGTLLAFGSPLVNRQAAQENENPQVVETKAPAYPAIARLAHASGSVVIKVEIGADGMVTSARAISGHPLLYEASSNAAKAWRFSAAPIGGGNRSVQLIFDFDIETTGCGAAATVSAYHLRIHPEPPPETISYVPDDAEARHCKVHGNRLLRDKVEIRYGLIGFQAGYLEAENKLFPEANSVAFGGCLIETTICEGKPVLLSPKYAEILYCPVCRRAEAKWSRQHANNPIQP